MNQSYEYVIDSNKAILREEKLSSGKLEFMGNRPAFLACHNHSHNEFAHLTGNFLIFTGLFGISIFCIPCLADGIPCILSVDVFSALKLASNCATGTHRRFDGSEDLN